MSSQQYYGNERPAYGQQPQGGQEYYPQQGAPQQGNMPYSDAKAGGQPPFDRPNEQWSNSGYQNQAPPQYQGYPPESYPGNFNQQPAYGSEYRQGADLPAGAPMQPGVGPEGDRGMMGALAGGAAGAYGGHQMGHGVIGGLAGAYAGSKLEDHFKDKKGKDHKRRDSSSSSSSGSDHDKKHGRRAGKEERREERRRRREEKHDRHHHHH